MNRLNACGTFNLEALACPLAVGGKRWIKVYTSPIALSQPVQIWKGICQLSNLQIIIMPLGLTLAAQCNLTNSLPSTSGHS